VRPDAGVADPGYRFLLPADCFSPPDRQNHRTVTLTSSKLPATAMEELPHDENWRPWFRQYGPRLLVCARLWTRTRADAEDVVQEAFVRFWRHQRRLGGDPLPLLLTSVRRAATDLARSQSRRVVREELAGLDADDSLFESDERSAGLETALQRLPSAQREVLALKIWGGLTFAQIAEQLGIPPDTAASRYRYALATLRKDLTPLAHE
jgi:RNA polymerase sigma-70 factor (ECF subfamily)